jgi:general secretion pathway protein G
MRAAAAKFSQKDHLTHFFSLGLFWKRLRPWLVTPVSGNVRVDSRERPLMRRVSSVAKKRDMLLTNPDSFLEGFTGDKQMRKNSGFTLVELVVVVMILGILAAVAAPKVMGTSAKATDNSVKQTLAVVRDAIERYAAEHGGALPGASDDSAATFKLDLKDYLRGAFPKCPVGGADDSVEIKDDAGAITVSGTGSWHYSTETGEFIVNSADPVPSMTGVNYNQL